MKYNTEEKIFISKKYTILNYTILVQRASRTKFKNYKARGYYTLVKGPDFMHHQINEFFTKKSFLSPK